MNLSTLNALDHPAAAAEFLKCCGAQWWAQQMAHARPYRTERELHDAADGIFDAMDQGHWLEAFEQHPRLGDTQSLRMKFAGNKQWSGDEQSATAEADDATLQQLAQRNDAYEAKFHHRFILCATGVTADAMLDALRQRLRHDPATEAAIASNEQRKITHLRLDKLLEL